MSSHLTFNKLSPIEKEVALHIANGLTTTTIAETIGIKCNTVSTYKKKIYIKLGVDSTVALYKVLQGI